MLRITVGYQKCQEACQDQFVFHTLVDLSLKVVFPEGRVLHLNTWRVFFNLTCSCRFAPSNLSNLRFGKLSPLCAAQPRGKLIHLLPRGCAAHRGEKLPESNFEGAKSAAHRGEKLPESNFEGA